MEPGELSDIGAGSKTSIPLVYLTALLISALIQSGPCADIACPLMGQILRKSLFNG